MKTSFKTLVRAISPFVGPKGRNEPEAERTYADYHWDLTKVDMEVMLTSFYKVYNPERVSKVPQILGEFGGEEILMLQQLCERYKLNEADIQRFLDDAPLGKKDRFGNWMRRNDALAALHSSGSEDQSKAVVDYGTYKWDLEGIDLAKALKLLYRTHNPEKKPNVATLQNKTTADKVLLLQQLCKRHNLSQGDMRAFLDKARIKGNASDNNVGSRGSAADDSSTSSRSRAARAAMEAAVGLFSAPVQKPPPPPPPAPPASTVQGGTGGGGGEAPNVITGAGLQRQGSLPFWPNSFPSPVPGSSPPPPPPPTPPRLPQSTISGFFADAFASKGSPGSEVGSVNSSVTAPTIVSGLGTRSKLGAAVAARAASAGSASVGSANRLQRAPSPAPSVLTTSSIGSASVGRGLRAASAGSASARSAAALAVPAASADSVTDQDSRSRVRSAKGDASLASKQLSVRGASVSSAAEAHSAELLQMQTELSEARTRVAGLERENRALQKALQESRQRQSDAESTISGLSSQPHPEQVPELLLEVSKLNGQLKQQEERELALKRQFNVVKQQVAELQELCGRAEKKGEEARADCRDVLRLVDIMSASPAGIRAVLEAYLKKLGDATNNMTVKLGIGTDGRQVPISERIALALQLKREQERPGADGASGAGTGSARHERSSKRRSDNDGRAASGGALGEVHAEVDEGDVSQGQSGGGIQQSHCDNYELFRTKIAQARQKGRDKAPSRSPVGSVTSSGVPEDSKVPELQRGDAEPAAAVREEGGDFADYASPEPTRRARTAERLGGHGSANPTEPDTAQSVEGNAAADWIECFDPRSRRKYYYSAALKKSTWVRPASFSGPASRAASPATGTAEKQAAGAPALASMVSGVPTRYASPLAPSRQLQEQQQQLQEHEVQGHHHDRANDHARAMVRLNRDSSPATAPVESSAALYSANVSGPFSSGSFSTHGSASDYSALFTSPKKGLVAPGSHALARSGSTKVGSSSPAPSRSSRPAASLHSRSTLSRSSSPAAAARGGGAEDARADWVVAVDPRSQRKYWYNRRTKVSTWRQPAELIV